MKRTRYTWASVGLALLLASSLAGARERWTADAANGWYAQQPWPLGSNYIPANAINQLEMWQADTFDPQRIDRELGWAQQLGMTTMRVFLHDLLWQQDPRGFKDRIGKFLDIASKHGIRPIFVLFDSCWDPSPVLGRQHPPIPGVHNSGWVQSPSGAELADPSSYPKLRAYVEGVVGAFADDRRIFAWDVWNEPQNHGPEDYAAFEAHDKPALVAALLPQVFAWARGVNPVQPLTSGLWDHEDWSPGAALDGVEAVQVAQSDILSFHDYSWPEKFAGRIRQLVRYGRPIVCTEYMARGAGSTFDNDLAIGKKAGVGMVNWGFVVGKIQTNLPWDSWQRPYTLQKPPVWFHDVLNADGTPYRAREAELLRAFSASPKGEIPVVNP